VSETCTSTGLTDSTTPASAPHVLRPGLLIAGILLVATNMRAGITVVGPLLGDVRSELHISAAAASALISLPVLCFAVFSPIAPPIANRLGMERTLGLALVLLTVGILARSLPFTPALWGGTVVLGVAIAAINVVLPALLKRDFPARAGQLTGAYAAVQSAAAAAASGLAVPIAGSTESGWRIAFGVWAGLSLIGLAVFFPQLRRRTVPTSGVATVLDPHPSEYRSPWRSWLAWQVTIFMGTQSTLYFVVLTWWPTVEHSQGFSVATAGLHQGLLQISGIVGSVVCGMLLHRWHSDQRVLALCVAPLPIVAILGQFAWPQGAILWNVIIGLSTGSTLVLALTLFGLRTSHHGQAAALSGMAQSLGYVLAAAGPMVFGLLHDATGGWRASLVMVVALSAVQVTVAYLAGRPRVIGVSRE
jgi:CP family cyanate transporter-like MFS transporter